MKNKTIKIAVGLVICLATLGFLYTMINAGIERDAAKEQAEQSK